jgi:hypothetical protein
VSFFFKLNEFGFFGPSRLCHDSSFFPLLSCRLLTANHTVIADIYYMGAVAEYTIVTALPAVVSSINCAVMLSAAAFIRVGIRDGVCRG